MAKIAAPIERPKAKSSSASGGFASWSPDFLVRQGLCTWTRLGALPQTPVIGSRYRARHGGVAHPDIAGYNRHCRRLFLLSTAIE